MNKKGITPDNLPEIDNPLADPMQQPQGAGTVRVQEKPQGGVEVEPGYKPTHCPKCAAPLKEVPTWYADDGRPMHPALACPTCGIINVKVKEEPVEKRFPTRGERCAECVRLKRTGCAKCVGTVEQSPWLKSILQPMNRPGPAMGVITAAPSQEFAMDQAADVLQGG